MQYKFQFTHDCIGILHENPPDPTYLKTGIKRLLLLFMLSLPAFFHARDSFVDTGVNGTNQTAGPIEVRQILTNRDLAVFINLPWQIYTDDPNWVPPLKLERRLHFSGLNPYFRNATWQAWVAYHGDRPVGRICAQIDQVNRQYHGQHTGHFGLLEAINDPGVFAALTRAGEDWLSNRQTSHISGPFSFSINQECGILVDGFDTPPVILMPHSRYWYGPLLEMQGYKPAMDMLAYWIETDFEPSRVMKTLVARFDKRIHLRQLRRKKFKQEMEILRDIFNDAWAGNWGFIPFSMEEFADLGNSLRLFIRDDFVQIAELDGHPVAFVVVLPNLNEVLTRLDGKLLPFGWLRLYKAMKQKAFRTGRVPLMGVRKQYQNSSLGLTLALMVCNAARHCAKAVGIGAVEMSWILENNWGMRSILDNIGSKEYKRYRIYEKNL